MLLLVIVSCFCIIVARSLQDSPPTNPFGFYCVDGIGDYRGIDFIQESEMFVPKGANPRPLESHSSSNVYDTYNADECRRVRRPWNAMEQSERDLYISGLLELRKRGQMDMDQDELVAVASVHDNIFGSVTHQDSDYLFWHGYLVWELESRIRNLGGEWRCFGMPYWDWTHEYDHEDDSEIPYIYQTGLGGYGDPNNYWAVNDFSWDVSTDAYWSPIKKDAECSAVGDVCPVCAMKRVGLDFMSQASSSIKSAAGNGAAIVNIDTFADFSRWVVMECGLPHAIDNSYDPIWYLFHSMESYYQAMFVNCHGFDDLDNLEGNADAFHPYCDDATVEDCVGIKLNDPLYFGGVLSKRPWSFIHNEKLTIHKLYSLPQWNVRYDLNGDDFYSKSGLREHCAHMLNSEWFVLPTENIDDDADEQREIRYERRESMDVIMQTLRDNIVLIALSVTFVVVFLLFFGLRKMVS
eukprot:CAMPEP_0202727544 /NCGR_PEP_ID=MMETSP1385-20130828/185179_1 /ASSEMBLY_ACC=CAM_ASM_000861 /TAXON_ID=933848 /ORGANISM="Elphidium margaritaceum" /LENGTH=464 /DNA_ID=CAMNT_0049393787 /DNA_START=20 /DNA_END=1414 /DNA_ORIENTATION=+